MKPRARVEEAEKQLKLALTDENITDPMVRRQLRSAISLTGSVQWSLDPPEAENP